ncbi:unnamed protein product [Chondrus crispus]|uniref:Uncharacterized protein n=1 Tax=Chondrus crispus TaxID=2769 RepID=R7QDW2_CHOCR|nr:unnamed protein product [Chondrus crispus]CDF35636.1 unnamed protein product [Chondrus crispus]|eukprot:XP_005715455.1 unnamed protein product [Chondrus crispus]
MKRASGNESLDFFPLFFFFFPFFLYFARTVYLYAWCLWWREGGAFAGKAWKRPDKEVC